MGRCTLEAKPTRQQPAVQGVGVDAPQDSDLYYRLVIAECFYVGGLGAGAAAEVISADDLAAAEPDRWACAALHAAGSRASRCTARRRVLGAALHCTCQGLGVRGAICRAGLKVPSRRAR